jgi:hypothetical protein
MWNENWHPLGPLPENFGDWNWIVHNPGLGQDVSIKFYSRLCRMTINPLPRVDGDKKCNIPFESKHNVVRS